MISEELIGQACSVNGVITALPDKLAYAMAYVPFQQYTTVYDPEKALECGTLFPELNKPFLGGGLK